MTLLGDAAHPMYPQGGNGGAQAIIDAATLARLLASEADAGAALKAYEAARLPATSRIVLQNRTAPPNVIVDTVEQRTGGNASTSSKTSSARTSCGRSSSATRRSPAIMCNRSDAHRGESWQIRLPSLKLTSDGAMKLLHAAMAKAKEMGVPQCISIVDPGGHLLAFARMDGAFLQSIDTSLMKAMTAASYGVPTGDIAAGIDLKLAIATQGKRINLPGGLPIIVDGHVIGGIGVGSGTGEQDQQVANAALGALSGARTF